VLILLTFAVFLSVTYTTLNILFAVFIYYICSFTKEVLALVSLASNVLPYTLVGLCVKFRANPFKNG